MLVFLVLFLAASAMAIVHDSVDTLPRVRFDFVIVGGGTAGNVLANRLTENAQHTVLVLEAGGSNDGVLQSEVPFFVPQLVPNTPWDWNFTTTPQAGLNGRSLSYPRGHLLGGSSSVNYMMYSRGYADDWNRYAEVTGDDGWSWDNMLPYILKTEKFVPPADGHNISGEFDPNVHSYDGMTSVSLPGFPRGSSSRVIDAAQELAFPVGLNYNDGYSKGVGYIQGTVGNGTRSSSATSYLASKYRNRPNLHVLLRAYVTRILSESPKNTSTPLLNIVEYALGSNKSLVHRAEARHEVILSAGSIGTPHILLNSGIGDANALGALGINSTLDLPSVGQNLTDHPGWTLVWSISDDTAFESRYWRNSTLQEEALQEWNLSRTGLLTSPPTIQVAFLRLPEEEVVWEDKCAGSNGPHYELLFGDDLFPRTAETGDTFAIATIDMCPLSRGNVSINGTDPFAPPLINPNFLSNPQDLEILNAVIKRAQRFARASAFDGYITAPLTDISEAAIRGSLGGIDHPVSTASMSPLGADWGVVDPDLRLKGANGVRVVDASVLPFIPAAHTQASVYAVAERAAELIKESLGL